MMAVLWLCRYAITCVSPQNRLKCVNIGGHYGRVKAGYNGNGGYNGPKAGDTMVRGDTMVGADTMVHNRRKICNGQQCDVVH